MQAGPMKMSRFCSPHRRAATRERGTPHLQCATFEPGIATMLTVTSLLGLAHRWKPVPCRARRNSPYALTKRAPS